MNKDSDTNRRSHAFENLARLFVILASVFASLGWFTGPAMAAPGDIMTVAGRGIGDGGPALWADLDDPYGVAVDPSGNIYIADMYNNRIRKVDTSGVITTVAGNGIMGYSGDGGPAVSASLYGPSGVAVDSSGNIYIADSWNDRIRKVDTSGVITTVASLNQPRGVAVDPSGNIYIAAFSIWKVDISGVITTVAGNGTEGYSGDGGPAVSASLNWPRGVAVDSSGNIYIADSWNYRIRKVDTSGVITTVAGNGTRGYSGDGGPAISAGLYNPNGIVVDSSGNIYIAESELFFMTNDNNRIRKVDTSGVITTVAGNGTMSYSGDGGPAISAGLNFPNGVALDSSGDLYIADCDNDRIRKVDTSGVITTVAGTGVGGYTGDNGPATSAFLEFPSGVATDSVGNIYISESFNARIRKVDTSGVMTTVAGNGTEGYSGDGGPAVSASLNFPIGVAVDSSGNIYIADCRNDRIRKVDTSGVITTVAGNGTWGYSGDGGPAFSSSLKQPNGVAVDPSGNIYIADSNNARIRKVDTSGVITTVAGNGMWGYSGDGGPAVSAELDYPTGVAVDTSGNIYIADRDNDRIRKVDASGLITTVAGNWTWGYYGDGGPAVSAGLNWPEGVAVDVAGNIYIADLYNDRIRRIDASGVITTVAGNGTEGYSGDGGPAVSASLYYPTGIAVDLAGNILIADLRNDRIRKVEGPWVISAKFGVFTDGLWYFDNNGSRAWDGGPADTMEIFGKGLASAIPIAGDWDGNGIMKIGVFADGYLYLDMNNNNQWDGEPTDIIGVFGAGLSGAVPITGDWNGNGTTNIGVFANGYWYLDMDNNRQWDGEPADKMAVFGVGLAGAVPVTGDWTGNGITKIGVYMAGIWYLDLNGNWQWDGEPTDKMAVFGMGLTNELPVTGDWNGDNISEIGIYQDGRWYLDINNNGVWDSGPSDYSGVFGAGLSGATAVPGKW